MGRENKVKGSATRQVGFLLLHSVISTVGAALSSNYIFYSVKPVLAVFVSQASLAHDTLLLLPLFPLQSTVAFAIGNFLAFKRGEFFTSRTAGYVWVIPTVWFLVFFLARGSNRWDFFVWSSDFPAKKFQLVFTLPIVTSVAYAMGNSAGGCYKVMKTLGDR